MRRQRKAKSPGDRSHKLTDGAVGAAELQAAFPRIALPIRPPYPPMEAKLVDEIPRGDNWQYEPKWDGFRCLAFRKGNYVLLQSKAGQPLGRYFPEVVAALLKLKATEFVLDGEIVILHGEVLSFDELLMRIHPAASRITKLSEETPATYLLFDLLVDDKGTSLAEEPLTERRKSLEHLVKSFGKQGSIRLSPATRDYDKAQRWMSELAASGFDGVVAKELDCPYASGERTAMRKIKLIRTADCVVGGFRYASKGGEVGSLLLGLYDEDGKLITWASAPVLPRPNARSSRRYSGRTWADRDSRDTRPAAPVAGAPSAVVNGCRCSRSWCARSATITFPATASGTGQSFCAGGRRRRRRAARTSR